MQKQLNFALTVVTCKLQGNTSAIEGAIYSWTLLRLTNLQLRVEKVEVQSSKVYKDEVLKIMY